MKEKGLLSLLHWCECNEFELEDRIIIDHQLVQHGATPGLSMRSDLHAAPSAGVHLLIDFLPPLSSFSFMLSSSS